MYKPVTYFWLKLGGYTFAYLDSNNDRNRYWHLNANVVNIYYYLCYAKDIVLTILLLLSSGQLEIYPYALNDDEHPPALIRTLRNLVKPTTTGIPNSTVPYFMYNDQPDNGNPGSNYGHTKVSFCLSSTSLENVRLFVTLRSRLPNLNL